jgi:N,N'-diacetylchitobiose transport system substrate-binding protein
LRLSRLIEDGEPEIDQLGTVAQQALDEARRSAALDHSSIVKVFDVIVDGGEPWIVMQLVSGGSLEQSVTEHGRWPVDRVRGLAAALLDALAAAHAAGVLHRDVKPSNVLLTGSGQPLLTDFSIAKMIGVSADTTTGLLKGSAGYIAPERVMSASVGPEADLFGLGATLYFAVEGRAPFTTTDPIAGAIAAAGTPHARPTHAGPLTPLIDGLLAKSPRQRLTVAQAQAMLRGEATVRVGVPGAPNERATVPAGPTVETARPRRRVGVVLVAVAAACVLAAAILFGTHAVLTGAKGSSSSTAPPNPLDGHGKTLTVWLMVDAESGWPQAVADANAAFTKATGAQVRVEYQNWNNHLAKVDRTLAAGGVPDVMELGNTEMPKYASTGAFADLTARVATFDNSSSWLPGLAEPCQVGGKTYCVPYYAGARILLYRTDLFQAAGLSPPSTYDQLFADATALAAAHRSDPNFAAFYLPGRYWYAAMSFVYGNGGAIATHSATGTWVGTLQGQPAETGLAQFAALARTFSPAAATRTEADQNAVFARGGAAMIYGNGWDLGAVQRQHRDPNDPTSPLIDTPVLGKVAAVPMPGNAAGEPMPSGLGGSDLAIPAGSHQQALAAEWIKDFTSTASERTLVADGALPNANVLLTAAAQQPASAAAATAAASSWITPLSPNWADVENAGVLQQMLQDIVTGRKTVDQAARAADAKINKILNPPA